jgi:putative membrane protein
MAVSNSVQKNSDELAMDRTVLAAERTLMAWIRTAFSMIGFGFTIYNFLKSFQGTPGVHVSKHGPRNFGMALIALGTASLIVATFQHIGYVKQLGRKRGDVWSLATMVAILITLIGILAFLSVLLREGPF